MKRLLRRPLAATTNSSRNTARGQAEETRWKPPPPSPRDQKLQMAWRVLAVPVCQGRHSRAGMWLGGVRRTREVGDGIELALANYLYLFCGQLPVPEAWNWSVTNVPWWCRKPASDNFFPSFPAVCSTVTWVAREKERGLIEMMQFILFMINNQISKW